MNRAGSERAATQFVLSPRHATVVSDAVFGGVKKGASQLMSNTSDDHHRISSRAAMEIAWALRRTAMRPRHILLGGLAYLLLITSG